MPNKNDCLDFVTFWSDAETNIIVSYEYSLSLQ